jgi:hypothetical protein
LPYTLAYLLLRDPYLLAHFATDALDPQ